MSQQTFTVQLFPESVSTFVNRVFFKKKFKALTLEQERGLHGSLARWAPDHIIFGPIFGLGLRRNDEAVGRGEVAPGEGGNDV